MLFSSYNAISLSLISRLSKEGHKVFVVNEGLEKGKLKPRGVFQEYDFRYDSKSLSYIIDNTDAEIAIFAGKIFSLPKYLYSVTNVMLSLKNSSIKKYIYISSLSVFDGNRESIVDEETEAFPITDKDKTILMGEKICRDYAVDQDFDVNIVRLSKVYGSYRNVYLKRNICTDVCRKIIDDQEIEVFRDRKYNLLYLDDAVDAIYKVINDDSDKYEIYHVASKKERANLEEDIIESLKDEVDYSKEIKIVEDKTNIIDKEYRIDKIEKLGFLEKYELEDKIGELYSVIKKDRERLSIVGDERISIFCRVFNIDDKIKNKIFPFVENLAFFILLNLFILITKDMNFHKVLDLYLLYVIVIGLIYGYEQTIFTVVLSVFSRVWLILYGNPYLSLGNDFIYVWILQIFGVGILVGYLKEQYKLKYMDMKDRNDYLYSQLEDIKEINQSNKEIKELYEKRLLNYKHSFGKTYEIIAELYLISPSAIIFKSIKVIEDLMETKNVSIYVSSGKSEYFRLLAASAQRQGIDKASLKLSDHDKIFERLAKKEIYSNASLDPNLPVMASGIYKKNELRSVIMIWDLAFENNNLYQMNIFGVISRLIEGNLNVAYEYMQNLNLAYDIKYNNVLDQRTFETNLELYRASLKEGIVEFYLLKVKKDVHISQENFIDILHKSIRETDYIGVKENGEIDILLVNTDEEESQYVVDRLELIGIDVEKSELCEE